MLKVTIKKEAEVYSSNDERKGQVEEFQTEFETLFELEHYLAYNRAYIREIKFTGTLTK
jgi:hypothetical protein